MKVTPISGDGVLESGANTTLMYQTEHSSHVTPDVTVDVMSQTQQL